MNKTHRTVWSEARGGFVVVHEKTAARGKPSSTRKSIVRAVAAALLAMSAGGAFAAPAVNELPTGGSVVAGDATIATSGARMDILQTTQRVALDWNTFNIGSAAHVHFEQPTGGAALNRVLDTNASQIYGKLTSTDQVFLVNPNGVFFAPGAQVDVGGLVASTLNIGNSDFMAGNYSFEGASSSAIINQGNITAANGGSIALIAARIVNDGSLTANGGNVLMGAGNKVVLDLGGPVKIQVDQGALDALIEQNGAIKADGGLVYLTAKSAGDLMATVINNTGVIEAQTLATGEKGQIMLMGDMEHGRIVVDGTLDASAPNGGDGGFIETSAAKVEFAESLHVTTLAASGATGNWLIDPATYTVAASGGDETGAALAGRLAGTNITLQADNAVNINDAVSWSANKLTLSSGNNIAINADLTATGTASLAFEYGQGTADGAGSSYTVATGAHIYIPTATAFTWKKGSGGTTTNLVFNNGNLRFGNGTQASINNLGQLEQPWYFDDTSVVSGSQRNGWYKLTFSGYPLDLEVGLGGDGTNSWNRNGELHNTQGDLNTKIAGLSLDISGYREGYGVVTSSLDLDFDSGDQINISNTYTLGATAAFIKTDTVLTNRSTTTPVTNVRLWVGTRDDYVAQDDSPTKYKGNLSSNGFEAITAQNQQSSALRVDEREDGEGASILFYSTNTGADTSINSCCSFTNATATDPRLSQISISQADGSYALFMRMNDLEASESQSLTWYYAAAPASQINDVVTTVAQSAGVAPATPTPTPTPNTIPIDAAINIAQMIAQAGPFQPLANTAIISGTPTPAAPPPSVVVSQQGSLPVYDVSGGLAFVQVTSPGAAAAPAGGGGTEADDVGGAGGTTINIAGLPTDLGGRDPQGFMNVFVVNGGLNLSGIVPDAPTSNNPNQRNDQN